MQTFQFKKTDYYINSIQQFTMSNSININIHFSKEHTPQHLVGALLSDLVHGVGKVFHIGRGNACYRDASVFG